MRCLDGRVAVVGTGHGQVRVTPARRGIVTEVGAEVEAAGPLGLMPWSRWVPLSLPAAIEVAPAPSPVTLDDLADLTTAEADASTPSGRGDGMVRGVRPYSAGDPLRHVHWPATARWGDMMVKELEIPLESALVIIADLRGDPDRGEEAASIAAGLAGVALGAGYSVSLLTAEADGPRAGTVATPRGGPAPGPGRRRCRPAGPTAGRGGRSGGSHTGGRANEGDRLAWSAPVSEESWVSRLKRANARQPAEEDIRVRLCVLVAAMAASLSLVEEGVGSPLFRLVVIAGLPAAYWYSWRSRHREGFWVKGIVALGALFSLVWFVKAIAPQAGGTFADAEVPLAQLLLLIQVLHGLDVPARRDLLFSLLSSAVLLAVAGALSVSMAFLPYLVVWGLAATTALVLAHRSELAEGSLLSPEDGASRRGSGLRVIPGLVALAVAGGLALFLVIPPAGTARALLFPARLLQLLPLPTPGELSNTSLGIGNPAAPRFSAEARAGGRAPYAYFGFSTSVDLSARGRPDHTVVMLVRADVPALWRGQTFDTWNGRSWTMSDQHTETVGGPPPISIPPAPGADAVLTDGPELVQTFYVRKPGPNLIFGAAPIEKVYFPDHEVYELPDGTLRARVEIGRGAVYTTVSRPAAVTAELLRRAGSSPSGTPAAIARQYASPPVITPRVRQLALQVTAGATSTYDKVLDLENWMAANTRYTLDVPPLPAGADAVDQFLFVDRRGFCEQIATSLTVMLRSLGVPSRVVAGYAPGLRNPFTGLFQVRASDAHLWTEVWFPGIGWQSFDPTAVVPLAGDTGSSRAGSGLGTYLGSELAGVPDWLEILLAAAIGVTAVALASRRLARAHRARRRRPPPSWAARCQARLEEAGASRGRPRAGSETVLEYAAALGDRSPPDQRLDRVGALVSAAAFSGEDLTADERQWVEGVLDELAGATGRQ